ncbi:MAG: hypothetical protein ACRDIV_17605 [Ktedonobacteraceae bacterium]
MNSKQETDNIIPLQKPSSSGNTGDPRIETALAKLQVFICDFQAEEQAVKRAAQTFREALHISPRQCSDVITVLQTIRKRAAACSELLDEQEQPVFKPLRYEVLSPLSSLDGEETARLILQLDAFRILCIKTGADRERINTHVQLQTALADSVKQIRDLNTALEKLPGKVREFALKVQGYYRYPPCTPGR